MSSFTVVLPRYKDFRISYPYAQFQEEFPDSVIALALQSGETEIPLDHPLVTPNVLEPLKYVVERNDYPPIPIEEKKSLDYLGIDFPDFVYDPAYSVFKQDAKDLSLKHDIEANYEKILHQAIESKVPSVAAYLLSQTDPKDYRQVDFKEFQDILGLDEKGQSKLRHVIHSGNREWIAEMILRNRDIQPLFTPIIVGSDMLTALRLGYASLFQMMSQLFDRSPREYQYEVMLSITLGIQQDPEHCRAYINTLLLIAPYMNDPESKSYKQYQLFQAVYSGNIDRVRTLLSESKIPDYIQAGYIWTAILTDHPDIVEVLMDTFHNEEFLYYYYVSHPTLITPEMLTVVGIHSEVSSRRSAIRELRSKGYTPLGRILYQMNKQ